MKIGKIAIGALTLIGFATLLFVSQSLLSSSTTETTQNTKDQLITDTNYRDYVKNNYSIFAIEIPNSIHFANELIPVQNTDVKERLEREFLVNTYWQSQTFLFHKRAGRWFPIIEPILKENGIPDDFKYLCVIESGLNNVVSPSGASGFWQFMKKTGLGYELEISNDVDERYHLEKATKAACSYLKEAHEKFGSWTLAAASYNMGKGGVNKRLTDQKVTSYYDLHLNSETSRYLMRIIAVKYILSESEYYGFRLREEDVYHPYTTRMIQVDTSITSLVDFAINQGISYRTLKVLNPWLRSKKLTIEEGNSYAIQIPTEGFELTGSIRDDNE